MNVITPSLRPGARSLPAELMIPHQYRGVDWGRQRMLAGGANRMQSRGGVRGLLGVGDCYNGSVDAGGMCPDGSYYTGALDSGGASVPGLTPTETTLPVIAAPTPVVIPPTATNYGAITTAINASSTAMAKILAASNPGTYYKDPQGNVIYSQPTGNTQNLPGVYGNTGGGSMGTFTTPLGSGTVSGFNTGTLMMVAVVGLAFMMMSRGR